MKKQLMLVGAMIFSMGFIVAQSNTAYTDQSGAGSNTSTVDQVGLDNDSDVDQVNTLSGSDNNVTDIDQN